MVWEWREEINTRRRFLGSSIVRMWLVWDREGQGEGGV